mmetsp:Transcript_3751/g.11512  ORF Transcript_3751/g.11512 Transcript_3751/m.11512 type:complete len:263 (-) Transcript_3751:522-1310(-)
MSRPLSRGRPRSSTAAAAGRARQRAEWLTPKSGPARHVRRLEVEGGGEDDVALDGGGGLVEGGLEVEVADGVGGGGELSEELVEAADDADDGALVGVGEFGEVEEVGAVGPLEDEGHHVGVEGIQVVALVDVDVGVSHGVVDSLGRFEEEFARLGEARPERRGFGCGRVLLLLGEDEARQERGDLGRFEVLKRASQKQLGGDELVRRVELAGRSALERDDAVGRDVVESSQDTAHPAQLVPQHHGPRLLGPGARRARQLLEG